MEFFMLFGERLGHSLSPAIHEALFEKYGRKGAYRLSEVPQNRFSQVGEAMRLLHIRGANVTIPYKVAIMPQLDKVDELALKVGAVNMVVNVNGQLTGYNTDVAGFTQMLGHHGLTVAGMPCVVLGAGGGCRAVVTALKALGASGIVVISRSAQEKAGQIPGVRYRGYEALGELGGGLLINTTPVGMYPNEGACPVLKADIARFSAVADIIYNPRETQLVRWASQMGLKACTGLYMLCAQAVCAQEIWWQEPLPQGAALWLYEKLEKELNL